MYGQTLKYTSSRYNIQVERLAKLYPLSYGQYKYKNWYCYTALYIIVKDIGNRIGNNGGNG
jgi:hypothetical protein